MEVFRNFGFADFAILKSRFFYEFCFLRLRRSVRPSPQTDKVAFTKKVSVISADPAIQSFTELHIRAFYDGKCLL
jgi:hypothetical protein